MVSPTEKLRHMRRAAMALAEIEAKRVYVQTLEAMIDRLLLEAAAYGSAGERESAIAKIEEYEAIRDRRDAFIREDLERMTATNAVQAR